MAKGDYILFNTVPFQSVTSYARRYGVMFDPSSSTSRFGIVDSGQRYAVRLTTEGIVEYSIDGDVNWNRINPLQDGCTGQQLPGFFSFDNKRIGEALTGVKFDMIAVGRGRIIGKEAGTDRLFHVYMDEIFRVISVGCNPGEKPPRTPIPDGDPYVPPFNMKLDPECFTTDPPTLIVPPEATRSYRNHPASLRLPIFNEVLELDITDLMLVMERARTWYLKDTRSQLAITSFDDFNFSEQDAIDVFSVERIRDILDSAKKALNELASGNPLLQLILNWMVDTNAIAQNWHNQLAEEGFGALVFPAYVALGVLLWGARHSHALKTQPDGEVQINVPAFLQFLSQPSGNPAAQKFIDDAIAKLTDGVAQLMLRSRRATLQSYGDRPDVNRVELPPEWTYENRMPTPNQPPAWMPVYVRTIYAPRKGTWRGTWTRFYELADQMQRVWLVSSPDGSLEAFAMDLTQVVMHTKQLGPNGDWDQMWKPLLQPFDRAGNLVIFRNTDGLLNLFGIAPDKRVLHTRETVQGGPWVAFEVLYSSSDQRIAIAAEANLDGRLEVFAVAADNSVLRTSETSPGTWSKKWIVESINKLRDLWMARNADGTLEVFGIAPDDRIWHTSQKTPGGEWSGSWSPLYSDADHLLSLAVGHNADGRLEIIGFARDNTIWRTSQDAPGNWKTGWTMLYSKDDLIKNVFVMNDTDGRLEVFGISPDNFVFHTWQMSPNGEFNGSWQQIDTGDARRVSLAAAPNVDGSVELLGISPDILSLRPWRLRLVPEKRYAIQFSQVLDIGIGASHWSENWQKHFGGEIHSLLQQRPLFQGERYSLIQYRFFNGPVIDGDAFNDGTTNFYALVKLGPVDQAAGQLLQDYAILWFDEQTYFTQRWRLVHPTDDILGDLFSLQHQLRDDPERFNFSLAKFWSPFRSNLINDKSRMAVRRNVIVVTGTNPQGRNEIYTIVFNYGLCDHTWRWRNFPSAQEVFVDRAAAQDPDPQLPPEVSNGNANAYVVVNTIDLRDDTMIHVRGSLRTGANPNLRLGRWVQRYLPADCRHVPERYELTGGRPATGFHHKWDFVSEAAYGRADQFYQFGVYENNIDSRGQYYEIDLLPDANGVTPTIDSVVGKTWLNDRQGAGEDRLRMNTIQFNWKVVKDAKGVIFKRYKPTASTTLLDPEFFVHKFRDRDSISMYELTTRFRILERKPLGLIAVFFDKRDDELQAASDLPQPTTLEWLDDRTQAIHVLVKGNRRVWSPPNVRKAQVVIDNAPGLRLLHISFWTPQTEHEVCENIWKVSLAAIDQAGAVFPIFSVPRYPNFVRRAVPDAPLPSNFTGDLGDAWRYDFDFPFTKEVETNVRRFCTPDGHIEFATSLWFEDVVGHRALPEELIFM